MRENAPIDFILLIKHICNIFDYLNIVKYESPQEIYLPQKGLDFFLVSRKGNMDDGFDSFKVNLYSFLRYYVSKQLPLTQGELRFLRIQRETIPFALLQGEI